MISVMDANDAAPTFSPTSLEYRVYVPPVIKNYQIGTAVANDRDLVDSLGYALREASEIGELFAIDRSTGMLRVAVNNSSVFKKKRYEVSLEKLNSHYLPKPTCLSQLKVLATDGIHTAEKTVAVVIVDRNKSQEEFPLHLRFPSDNYSFSIRENNTEAVRILSLWPSNSRLGEYFHFRLLTPHPGFVIDERAGLLSSDPRHLLDRELTSKIELLLEAVSSSNPDRKAICSVNIELEDVNDCAPTFTLIPYFATVSKEAKVGDRLLSVKAVDEDVGMNGVVRYKLANGSPTFLELNKYDGRLSISSPIPPNALEFGDQLTVNVIAEDMVC